MDRLARAVHALLDAVSRAALDPETERLVRRLIVLAVAALVARVLGGDIRDALVLLGM